MILNMSDKTKDLMIIALGCLFVLAVIGIFIATFFAYRDSSGIILSRTVDFSTLIRPVREICISSLPSRFGLSNKSKYMSHWFAVLDTDDLSVYIDICPYRGVRAIHELVKIDEYRYRLKDDKNANSIHHIIDNKKYKVRDNDTTVEDVIKYAFKWRRSKEGLYHITNNNCHHAIINIIRQFCIFDKDDDLLIKKTGMELVNTIADELRAQKTDDDELE